MPKSRSAAGDVDRYIARFPKDVREKLEAIRRTIHKAAPGAEEKISYQIPAFTVGGKDVVYLAGYERHIGLYPAPTGNAAFEKELAPYRSGKATVRFPLERRIPLGLIAKIVKRRLAG